MKVKICGLNNIESLQHVVEFDPDMIGLIFHEDSKRYAGGMDSAVVKEVGKNTLKVGVFVNSTMKHIKAMVEKYDLDLVQLHGDEDDVFVRNLRKEIQVQIIKVFRVMTKDDLNDIASYEGEADYFLFDTKGDKYGGNGEIFDWSILNDLKTSTPYFLSGGLGITELKHLPENLKNKIYAVDLNSKLEIAPGVKDPVLVKESIDIVRNE